MGVKLSKHHLHSKELEELQRKTNYTCEELHSLYKENRFNKRHSLKKGDLLKLLRKIFETRSEAADDALVDRVYELFDMNHDGSLSFEEFACGLSLLCRGTPEEKLGFIFGVFDLDRNGQISKEEFRNIVGIVYNSTLAQQILNIHVDKNNESLEDFIEDFFDKADVNGDGSISKTEYITVAMRDVLKGYDSNSSSSDEYPVNSHHPHTNETDQEIIDSPLPAHFSIRELGLKPTLKIVVLGPPYSKKKDIAVSLAKQFDLPHVSSAELIQNAVKNQTNAGMRAKYYTTHDLDIPDDIVAQIVEERLGYDDCLKSGWVLDGFPRTKGQVLFMNQSGLLPDRILILNTSDDEIRQNYEEAAAIKSKTSTNNNNNNNNIDERLVAYHENVKSIKQFYDHVIKEVNSNQSTEELYQECKEFITLQSSRRSSMTSLYSQNSK